MAAVLAVEEEAEADRFSSLARSVAEAVSVAAEEAASPVAADPEAEAARDEVGNPKSEGSLPRV